MLKLVWHGIKHRTFQVARNAKSFTEGTHEANLELQAEQAQGVQAFKTELVDVTTTPIISHLGEKLPEKTSPDIRGAAPLFEFLKANKRPFKFRMNLTPRTEFTRSNVVRALECLPKMAVGRYVW